MSIRIDQLHYLEERLATVNRFLVQHDTAGEWYLHYWTRVRDELKSKYIQAVMNGQLFPDVYCADS